MADQIKSQMQELCQSLARATREGLLKWKQTDSETTYIVSRPQGSLTIGSLDGDGGPPYGMYLFDESGTMIESLVEDRMQHASFDGDLRDLYQLARANALNIDTALRSWIEDIGELEKQRGGGYDDMTEEPF